MNDLNNIAKVATLTNTTALNPETVAGTTEHEHNYFSSEWFLVYITFLLALITGVLAFYTFRLWRATKKMVDSADATAKRQSSEMQASIAEASRAATAMELLVKGNAESVATLKDVTARQMRAYLVVDVNSGRYQERNKNIRFEVKPSLNNAGQTPAHKMTYWATAKIMPYPLPDNFDFPTPKNAALRPMFLGPHQGVELNAIVGDFIPDDEVVDVKAGMTRRVYIWGIVTYTDIFDTKHSTKFCHSLYWFGSGENERVSGSYAPHHNKAT